MKLQFSITALGRQFNLSRSALLYYDRIGLLKPSGRTAAGYRVYTARDQHRLARIMAFRDAGLSLSEITTVLAARGKPSVRVLEQRLESLGKEITALRQKQRLLSEMIRRSATGSRPSMVDKAMWVSLLRAAGMDEAAMLRWHREFERRAPQAHEEFLVSIGIGPEERARIRAM